MSGRELQGYRRPIAPNSFGKLHRLALHAALPSPGVIVESAQRTRSIPLLQHRATTQCDGGFSPGASSREPQGPRCKVSSERSRAMWRWRGLLASSCFGFSILYSTLSGCAFLVQHQLHPRRKTSRTCHPPLPLVFEIRLAAQHPGHHLRARY